MAALVFPNYLYLHEREREREREREIKTNKGRESATTHQCHTLIMSYNDKNNHRSLLALSRNVLFHRSLLFSQESPWYRSLLTTACCFVAANFIIKGFTNPTAGRRCRKKRAVGKSGLSEKAGCLTPHAGLSETAGPKQQRERERERD